MDNISVIFHVEDMDLNTLFVISLGIKNISFILSCKQVIKANYLYLLIKTFLGCVILKGAPACSHISYGCQMQNNLLNKDDVYLR